MSMIRNRQSRRCRRTQGISMKSIILWLCGVPVVVIIALKIFGVF
jgi:hypothetical protein